MHMYTYIYHPLSSRKQAAMLVHKKFVARAYSHHMYALIALVKIWLKKQEQMDLKVYFVINVVPANYQGSGS